MLRTITALAVAATAAATITTSAAAATEVPGIDVSNHNGTISWSQVAAAGIKWTYSKATEGNYYVDSYFSGNNSGAKANGVLSGAYHFARPELSGGAAQADYFIDRAQYATDGKTLPPMLDIEMPWKAETPRCWGLSKDAMAAWIKDFLARVKVRTGQNATVYTNYYWWNDCVGATGNLDAHPLFIANYDPVAQPMIPSAWTRWTFWQYTEYGSVPGVSGNVDRNRFNGDLAALSALTGARGSSVSGDARAEIVSLNGDGVVNAFINNGWNGGVPFGGHTTIGQGWNDPSRVRFADVNGDGRKEIISLNADGTVNSYTNNGWNGGIPFGGSTTVGWGWNSPDRTHFADINGDSRDEIISVNSDGTVSAYLNNGGATPYSTCTTIGTGWTDHTRIKFADVNGDGRDEIISLNADGTVNSYTNNGWNGGIPFGGSTTVGWGWNSPDRTHFADINGDSRDEIISVNSDGTVSAYLNNGGATPYSTGTTIATGWTDHTRVKFA